MLNHAKKFFPLALLLVLLLYTIPSMAANADDPVITYTTDGYYRGYPVIYARDLSITEAEPGFTGFTVTSKQTVYFTDITFTEGYKLPGTGSVKVVYDSSALCDFAAPGEGEVKIIATDAFGNTATETAWCMVKPIDAPYYADDADNPVNERENRTMLDVMSGEAYMFDRKDFETERLVAPGGLGAINIDTLPKNGVLSFYGAGKYKPLTKKDLPFRVTIFDIRSGKITYTPKKAGEDSFMFRIEDCYKNVAQMQSEIEIIVFEPNQATEEAPQDVTDDAANEDMAELEPTLSDKVHAIMTALPDTALVKLIHEPGELRQAAANIKSELKALGNIDTKTLTTPEKQLINDTIDTLLWEANAIELLNTAGDGPIADTKKANKLMSSMPGLKYLSEEIATEFLTLYTMSKADILIADAMENDDGYVNDELLKALEDAIIQCVLARGYEAITDDIEDMYTVYFNLARELNVFTENGGATLLGMFSRVDYSSVPDDIMTSMIYFEIIEAEQLSAVPSVAGNSIENGEANAEGGAKESPKENEENKEEEIAGRYYFVEAFDVKLRGLFDNTNLPAELSFTEGEQGLLCLPVSLAGEPYDVSTLKVLRAEENSTVELEILRTELIDGNSYIFLPVSSNGRIEIYAKLLPEADAADEQTKESIVENPPADDPKELPEEEPQKEPSTAPHTMLTPEKGTQPEKTAEQDVMGQETAEQETLEEIAPTSVPEKETAPVSDFASEPAPKSYNMPAFIATIPPIYIIGGFTFLIVLLRIIWGIGRNARKSEGNAVNSEKNNDKEVKDEKSVAN